MVLWSSYLTIATPIVFTVNGKIITISPPSDLPTLYSIPTNAIFICAIPGVTNYQFSYSTFTNFISQFASGGGDSSSTTNGIVQLQNGTKTVNASWLTTNSTISLTYISTNTYSPIWLVATDLLYGSSFTIQSGYTNDSSKIMWSAIIQ